MRSLLQRPAEVLGLLVGWADAFDVFGPPAGSWNDLPAPASGGAKVYDRSDARGRVIGELGPSGFLTNEELRDDPSSPVTTAVYDSDDG